MTTKLHMIDEHVRRTGPNLASELKSLSEDLKLKQSMDSLKQRNRHLYEKLRRREEVFTREKQSWPRRTGGSMINKKGRQVGVGILTF